MPFIDLSDLLNNLQSNQQTEKKIIGAIWFQKPPDVLALVLSSSLLLTSSSSSSRSPSSSESFRSWLSLSRFRLSSFLLEVEELREDTSPGSGLQFFDSEEGVRGGDKMWYTKREG